MEPDFFPIPAPCLAERLKPVFSALLCRQSAFFLGAPGSGKSSHWQFCLSRREFLKSLLPATADFHFIYLNPNLCPVLNMESFYKMILSQAVGSLEEKSELYSLAKRQAEKIIFTSDYFLVINSCRKILEELLKTKRVIFVIDYFEKLAAIDPDIIRTLKSFWQMGRLQPLEKVSFLILSEPRPVFDKDSVLTKGLLELVGENFFFSPLLDYKESLYSYRRHAKFRGYRLKSEEEEMLWKTIGGLGSVFRYAIQILEKTASAKSDSREEFLFSNPQIKEAVWQVLASLPVKTQKEFLNFLKKKLPPPAESLLWSLGLVRQNGGKLSPFGSVASILKEPKSDTVLSIGNGLVLTAELTAQEASLLDFFLKNSNKIIGKDEIAGALWGKNSFEKYSEWAMTKVINRLRRKIKKEGTFPSLLTVRGRGYKLLLN
ncbi:MAG: winged helix-turn-helix domain-containing protein [bacterium]|nr:winged helix-turn-helix domain-containing protein [bacterium]